MFKRLKKKIASVRKKQSKEIVINLEIDSKEIAKLISSHLKADLTIDDKLEENQ